MAPSAEYELAATEDPLSENATYTREEDENELLDTHLDGEPEILSKEQRKRLWWREAMINAMFIAAWFFFATVLSVYNKWMFSKEHFGFTWPFFVTTFHMFIQFALASSVRALWPKTFRPDHNPTLKDFSRKVVPTAVSTSLDIGLSNLSLKLITLSFYTMCKSSSLIFVLFFAFLFRLEKYSHRLVGVIFLIFIGVLIMSASETHFVLSGFLLVITASALGGLRWSMTQILLKDKTMGMDNPAATVYWLAPTMGVSLAIISMVVDNWFVVFSSRFFDGIIPILRTSFFLFAPGSIAFCMVMCEFYILKRAGVVPMSIAGIAKEVTTISISAWLFGDDLTPLNILGVAITVCGIALFTYHKYRKSVDLPPSIDVDGSPGFDPEPHLGQNIELQEHEGPSISTHAKGGGYVNADQAAGLAGTPLFSIEEDDDEDSHLKTNGNGIPVIGDTRQHAEQQDQGHWEHA